MVEKTMQGTSSMRYGSAVEADRGHPEKGAPAQRERGPVKKPSPASSNVKRIMDVVLSLGVLMFALPLIVVFGLLIKLGDGGPIFYYQTRVGRNGREFRCWKLRTMRQDADERLNELLANDPAAAEEWREFQKLRNDPRITPIGRFLRKTSLDELPQLFNILMGQMSVIGPRPVTEQETRRYGENVEYYKAVRPGVLGLWQVNGRNNLTYERRIQYDVEYVSDWSVGMDIGILLKAIPAVLFGRGAY